MELTMAAQEDATPWDLPPGLTTEEDSQDTNHDASNHTLPGRSYFSNLGIVRRKPSRPDAPPTLSKSCSDKISLNQCTSLLSSVTSLLIVPSSAYLSSIVLPESQYSEPACDRAFRSEGRMCKLRGRAWEGGYAFRPFKIKTTNREFKYSRRQHIVTGEKIVPSNVSSSYIYNPSQSSGKLEILIGGILQGRKQNDIRGASRVCKRSTWKLALDTAGLVDMPNLSVLLNARTYGEVKDGELMGIRRKVKEEVREVALRGWIQNVGDDTFKCAGV